MASFFPVARFRATDYRGEPPSRSPDSTSPSAPRKRARPRQRSLPTPRRNRLHTSIPCVRSSPCALQAHLALPSTSPAIASLTDRYVFAYAADSVPYPRRTSALNPFDSSASSPDAPHARRIFSAPGAPIHGDSLNTFRAACHSRGRLRFPTRSTGTASSGSPAAVHRTCAPAAPGARPSRGGFPAEPWSWPRCGCAASCPETAQPATDIETARSNSATSRARPPHRRAASRSYPSSTEEQILASRSRVAVVRPWSHDVRSEPGADLESTT